MLKRYRKFFTSAVGFTFVVVGCTGVFFKFFAKNHTLEEIHGWLGVAMVVAAIFHIVHNIESIRIYLQDKRVLALLIPVFLVVIFFSLNRREENRSVNPKLVMARLAEGEIAYTAKAFKKDPQSIIAAMRTDGLKVSVASTSLKSIAEENNRSPESLYVYFLN